MNIDKFTITSYDQFTGFDRTTGSLEMLMDELNDFKLSQDEEKTEISGKAGRTIGSLKRNKKVTGTGTNGMLSGGALATQLGATISNDESAKYKIKYTDTITVSSNKGSTVEKAVGTIGNEIGTIYVKDVDNAFITSGKKLTQVAETPTTGHFTYDPSSKEITFFEGDVADGTTVYAFYDAEVSGKKIENDADNYSKVLSCFVDVTCQDACDKTFHGQFIIPRADFSGKFDLQGGKDPATHGFEFESLPELCTGKSTLWDFIIFS